MPIVPLIDLARLKRATFPEMLDGSRDDVLTAAVEAATQNILTIIEPRLLVDPGAGTEWTEFYDGDNAAGRWRDEIYLRSFPIIQVVSVKENGVTLVAGTGYDGAGAFDVLIEKRLGVLRRRAGPAGMMVKNYSDAQRWWSEGRQNIEVKYRAGFDPAEIPGDLQMWCVLEATKFFEDPDRLGKTSSGRPSGSTSYGIDDLPPAYQAIAHRYIPWGRPRCWSGS